MCDFKKILNVFLAFIKKWLEKGLMFIVKHKKESRITAIVLAALVVLLIIFFVFIKPKIDYKHKVVLEINGNEYTQEKIDDIGDWWSSGDFSVIQEGDKNVD